MKKQIPAPPKPRHRNRPLAQTKVGTMSDRPKTLALMKRATRIIENSDGKHTRHTFAAAIGKSYKDGNEYLSAYRSAPNSEVTLRILEWCDKNEPAVKL